VLQPWPVKGTLNPRFIIHGIADMHDARTISPIRSSSRRATARTRSRDIIPRNVRVSEPVLPASRCWSTISNASGSELSAVATEIIQREKELIAGTRSQMARRAGQQHARP